MIREVWDLLNKSLLSLMISYVTAVAFNRETDVTNIKTSKGPMKINHMHLFTKAEQVVRHFFRLKL